MQERISPCSHFDYCNGCQYQNLEYSSQIALKEKQLKDIYQDIWKEKIEVVPSVSEFFYRNKVELSYRNFRLGLRRKDDTKEAFDLEQCHILGDNHTQVVNAVRDWLVENKVESFDSWKTTGDFRYLIYRESKFNKEKMLALVTFTEDLKEKIEEFAKELLKLEDVVSVYWCVNSKTGDSAVGDVKKIFGKKYLREKLLGCEFDYELYSFFQPNPKTAEIAIGEILKHIKPNMKVLDVFCGLGTISLNVAKKGAIVHGMEIGKEMIELAWHNAKLNKLNNATFEAGRARALLKFYKNEVDLAIVDPPRAGMTEKEIRRLTRLNPNKLIYLACNPVTQERDIKMLFEKGYELKSLKGFDFFPQTRHIECLAVLEKLIIRK